MSPPPHTPALLEDYRWLVSLAAEPVLAELAAHDPVPVAVAARLRKTLTHSQAALAMELADLRRRGKVKFAAAERMFFTRRALEQASGEAIARYKASRFPPGEPAADYCCGIGGDLLALAERGPVEGVDRDEVMTLLAEANARTAGHNTARLITSEIAPEQLQDCGAWHIDPDRRPAGRRTTQVDLADPPLELLEELLAICPHAAVKLAPAADPPSLWHEQAELEWIGHDRECRQLVAWHGELARAPGERVATVLDAAGQPHSLTGQESEPEWAEELGSHLYEPHAAVLAAHLSGALAEEHDWAAVADGIAYFTGEKPLTNPLWDTFEIEAVLSLDRKRLKRELRTRDIGRVEVKKRGLDLEPATLAAQLRGKGSRTATLLIYHDGNSAQAVLAGRVT